MNPPLSDTGGRADSNEGGSDISETVPIAKRPVLMHFRADWCKPCAQMAPVVGEVEREYAESLLVVSVDTHTPTGAAEAQRAGVTMIPTFVMYSGEREVSRLVGAHPKGDVRALIDGALT